MNNASVFNVDVNIISIPMACYTGYFQKEKGEYFSVTTSIMIEQVSEAVSIIQINY